MKRLCALLCLLAFSSCGDDEPDKYRDEASFCDEWAIEACNTTIVEECSNDETECRAAQKAYCRGLIPSGAYSKSGAKECIDAAADAFVDGRLDAEERDVVFNLEGPCSKIVSGSGTAGDSCDETRDCNTGDDLECVIKPGEEEGECHEPEEIEPGEECGGAGQVCEEGYFCDADAEACLRERNLDADCSISRPCREGYKCETEDGALVEAADDVGVCVEKAGNGDECMVDDDCTTNICAPNGNCVQRIDISGSSVFETCDIFRQ